MAASSSLCRVPVFRVSPLIIPAITLSHVLRPSVASLSTSSRMSCGPSQSQDGSGDHDNGRPSSSAIMTGSGRWRPMCLYHTQGKCTKVDDPIHMEQFNHDCKKDLRVCAAGVEYSGSQDMDYFLVLDLEGKVEILEYPVLIVDAKTLDVVDLFHRFVRPCQMSEQRINEYVEGKYGKLGVDRVWHDTAITFGDVIKQFEAWLSQNHLWNKELGGRLHRAAFVTCGNWDLKTKIPQQCKVSRIKLPPYFMEWINLKDVYLNFYHREARGMMSMMRQLNIQPLGSHHLGIDDTKNIARVLQRMLVDCAPMRITAWRNPRSPNSVQFAFEKRI
ncbi:hypothetical protein MLD38_035170 [Melastoma candidum]|uniref:Uncharacterized protein n=1 Tax=Melastoma candidum TaxID=119954 RepID=A0ACB9MC91_9MYRT|nr:hypothetical protein MLD38_035170 [Melastoma candidum]